MDGTEPALLPSFGEIYIVMAQPGHVRANHYHPRTSEWFTVIQGTAVLRLADPESGESREICLQAAEPQTVFVPAGVAHAFKNPETSGGECLLVAYADQPYDPVDTVAFKLFP
jgi:oxalate decarboxylase/phosphoglucose isomerase-like protein (cupin superfamily)